MTRPYSSIFSYYGGKSKLAPIYPAPIGDVVIEPFCGGASYSLLYYRHQVIINDKDPITASIWRFLLQADALDLVDRYVPREMTKGTRIDEIFDRSISEGLFHIMRSLCAPGSMGANQVCIQLTEWGAMSWHQVVPKLNYWIPKIAHWQFSSVDYSEIPNQEATWFIDPPYANAAGSMYRTNDVNYDHLSDYCRSRLGQVIVCENEGATWLPFKSFRNRAGSFTGRDSMTKADGGEVVWLQGDEGLLTFNDW